LKNNNKYKMGLDKIVLIFRELQLYTKIINFILNYNIYYII
jgi:hypothetical protein